MASDAAHATWDRRQAELWDRVFQVTQDVVSLADTLREGIGERTVKAELVRTAMRVGAELVRGSAADSRPAFVRHIAEARLLAVEADYWLRLAYLLDQQEEFQRDVSGIIAQYAAIIDLLHKFERHSQHEPDVIARHSKGPLVT